MVHAAIPTTYADVRFRSRLEARWAAFFDLLKWPWHYEPLDLNGYIPDFVLDFHEPLLVEVKPELSMADLHQHVGKIERSGWDKEALIVGARLFTDNEEPYLGLYRRKGGELWKRLGKTWSWVPSCGWSGAPFSKLTPVSKKLWAAAGNETQWRR